MMIMEKLLHSTHNKGIQKLPSTKVTQNRITIKDIDIIFVGKDFHFTLL